ncbi:ATP-binding cassette domain-containing protein [Peptococcus simiae]|uniref:ATP-binding cassette domain-containing protein n=1 Tax=Peptococcus simiae TaxID=1643805 RepID=A0ABW9GZR0_9FIRM
MNLTVKDNLKLYSFLFYDRKVAREEAICKMIDDFRLKTMINQKVRSLSLGMLQKLKLALTFMPSTSILILDEPFNGLDIEGVLLLKEKINEAKNMGKTIMITSHNTEQLANLCDNFVILHESRIYSVSKNQIKDNSLEDIYCNTRRYLLQYLT